MENNESTLELTKEQWIKLINEAKNLKCISFTTIRSEGEIINEKK